MHNRHFAATKFHGAKFIKFYHEHQNQIVTNFQFAIHALILHNNIRQLAINVIIPERTLAA